MRMLKSKLAELRENQLLKKATLLKGCQENRMGLSDTLLRVLPLHFGKRPSHQLRERRLSTRLWTEIEEFIIEYLKRGQVSEYYRAALERKALRRRFYILAVETSCDETAVAVLRGKEIKALSL